MRTIVMSVLMALMVLNAPVARAEDDGARELRSHRVRLDLGLASALGFGGLSYTYSPVEWFQLETGIGMAFSGPTVSLMPKYALGSNSDHLVVGAGLSLARNRAHFSGWLNADIGWEHLFSSGLLISAALGVTAGEHSDQVVPWEGSFRQVLPQLRFGVGYAFGSGREDARQESLVAELERPWMLKNRIGFDFGVLSAVGVTGVSYARQLADAFALEAGVGLGGSGVQLSLMPKLTTGSGGDYYVAGLGAAYALGLSKTPMFWVNADVLGYERRMDNGFGFSIALGATACVSGDTDGFLGVEKGFVAPQLRIGAAYWL